MSTFGTAYTWPRRRLRFDARINPVKSELNRANETVVSFVSMDAVGELGGLRLDEERQLDEVYTGYTYFRDGDVVIAKITPCFENGKGALADRLTNGIGFGTTELHVARPSEELNAHFLYYISIAHDFRCLGTAEMLGAGGQKRVPEHFLKDWRPALPPVEVQGRVVAFLDERTAQIDGMIARKQALLERLAERRQAIITQAVTKGLEAAMPLKDSGIDWLGQIPAHWDVLALRRLAARVVTGRTPPAGVGDFFTDGEVPWFTPGDFTSGLVLGPSEKCLIPAAFSEGHAVRFPAHSILLVGIGATLGKVAVAPIECSSNQQINAISTLPENDSRYLAYFLHGFRTEVRMTANGNTLAILNQDKTKCLTVLRPPFAEQQAIAARLSETDSAYEHVSRKVRGSIALLVERRATLITLAVTGQIEGLH
jgi:type I restriction enzyme S subunit